MNKIILILMSTIFTIHLAFGQSEKFTLSGQITDASTGEDLIGASLFVPSTGTGVGSNLYGFYSLTLPQGTYEIVVSYIGLQSKTLNIELAKNISQNITLELQANVLVDVVVVAEEKNKNVKDIDMGKVGLDVEAIKKMPALFGEVDIIKAIQILPGIKTIGEGTSGFYVRGGNADQNLILLDEAPIYNATHLLGFFSSFNPDAIKDMQIYKGSIPAFYGGRLSSVLDIRMKEGNSKKFGGALGIGSMMSRLTLEGPMTKKGSFMLSGRRSYLEPLFALASAIQKQENNGRQFYYYDLNAKVNYRLNENNRLFASGYLGRDVINMPDIGKMNWGNITSTLRLNHIFSPKFFANVTAYYSKYDYFLDIDDDIARFTWGAKLQEWSGKVDVTYFINPKNTLKFGLQTIKHDINPGQIKVYDKGVVTTSFDIQKNTSLENAFYVNNQQSFNDKLSVNYGVRLSSLSNLGPYTTFKLDDEYQVMDSIEHTKGSFNSHYHVEPRLGIRYSINESNSIKAAYNRTVQYIQQASNGNTATPLDIWFTSNEQIKPQLADQYSLGYFKNFKNNMFETSIEIYYKKFTNAIDFKERAQLLLNKNIDAELRFGEAKAYGVELSVKKQKGKITGQFGYTYSKVQKKINTINNNEWYNAKYDQPHNFSLILAYQLTKQWSVSGNFVYTSGNAVTFPTGKYVYGGTVVPVYSDRNGARLPVYHRLDISASRKSKRKLFKRFETEWVYSIYNVYNRKNAYSVNFKQDEANPGTTYAEKTAVFGIVPSFTFNAKF